MNLFQRHINYFFRNKFFLVVGMARTIKTLLTVSGYHFFIFFYSAYLIFGAHDLYIMLLPGTHIVGLILWVLLAVMMYLRAVNRRRPRVLVVFAFIPWLGFISAIWLVFVKVGVNDGWMPIIRHRMN
ncbi:MAG: hypothetical protein FI685_01190 [SAR202 cluster bacterium]|nr:hypothetical protein [SAR202 cluster bacterium]|tara:strand:- start:231 stop:611 length:381 start_codon:yes stop_codon:yes gene_type:complete